MPAPGAGMRDEEAERRLTVGQLGPGRDSYSKRARGRMALVVGAVAVVLLVIGAVLASNSKQKPPRVVTIPLADRSASAALLRAAEAVGFHSNAPSSAGAIENSPIPADEPFGGVEPSPGRDEGAGLQAPHPDRRARLARVATRQGGAARALRHLVPALCLRGAAPEGDVPRAPEATATPSSESTRTARTLRASSPTTSTSACPSRRSSTRTLGSRLVPPRGQPRAGVQGVQGGRVPDLLRDRPAGEDRLVGERRAAGRAAPARAARSGSRALAGATVSTCPEAVEVASRHAKSPCAPPTRRCGVPTCAA